MTGCSNCGCTVQTSGCGCAPGAGVGVPNTYEVHRYAAGVGWEAYILDSDLYFMRGGDWDEVVGDVGMMTWDEYQGVIRSADLGGYAWRVFRSDGKNVLTIGSAHDEEQSAWISRTPR